MVTHHCSIWGNTSVKGGQESILRAREKKQSKGVPTWKQTEVSTERRWKERHCSSLCILKYLTWPSTPRRHTRAPRLFVYPVVAWQMLAKQRSNGLASLQSVQLTVILACEGRSQARSPLRREQPRVVVLLDKSHLDLGREAGERPSSRLPQSTPLSSVLASAMPACQAIEVRNSG